MSTQAKLAEKILARHKNLRNLLQAGEIPLFNIPAIWDAGQRQRSTACDIVLTNQRLFGYYAKSFPREHLFLDSFALLQIKAVSLRHKTYEPLFREVLISDGQRKVYIRSSREKIESLYASLRLTIAQYTANGQTVFENEPASNASQTSPVYGRQEIRTPFERSSLAITLLFIGGILFELAGAVLWAATHSAQAGLPLFLAGFIAVITSILVRRQKR